MESVRLPIDRDVPASVMRGTVRDALRAWKIEDDDGDAQTVVTELVQNVWRHTEDGGELCLSLRRDPSGDALLIEVTDTNPQRPGPLPRDPKRIGGRGLQIVAAIAHRWGSRAATWAGHAGKIVWAELVYRTEPPPSSGRVASATS